MRLVKNTLANLASSFLGPLMAIFLTPFYIRRLGLEGYGLIGFFGALNALLGVVSAAMGKVYLREVAARTALPEQRNTVPAMFQNFFAFFAFLGVFVAGTIAFLSWWISHRWVHLEHLNPATVQACILLIAIALAGSFPTGVCVDTLYALQEQVRTNKIAMSVSLLVTAVAAGLVYRYNSVLAYYAATAAGALINLFLLRRRASRSLRMALGPEAPQPSIAHAIRSGRHDAMSVARMSLALMWTEGAGVAITQTDRMLLSSLLPLWTLGIYGVGASVGRVVQMVCNPFLSAAFPKLCQIVATCPGTNLGAREAFRQQAIVLVLASAVCLPVCALPETLLQLWIGNADIAASAAWITVIFALAYACLALGGAPYNFAVAGGHTRYAAIVNTAAVMWYPPLGYWLISRFGLLGAAILWLTYCAHALLACTFAVILFIDKTYCSARDAAKVLSVPLLAIVFGKAVQATPPFASHPSLSKLIYAGVASTLVLIVGSFLVLGAGQFTAICSRFFRKGRSLTVENS